MRECTDVPVDEWVAQATSLRDQGFSYFDFLAVVDETDTEPTPGFDLVLHLWKPGTPLEEKAIRTRVAEDAAAPSLSQVFSGIRWHEREAHEMFGLGFDGFDDGTGQGLRPLLLPDGFEGHPLRKSFVLTSRVSKDWPGAKEPGESPHSGGSSRRKMAPPGVPDPEWGPR